MKCALVNSMWLHVVDGAVPEKVDATLRAARELKGDAILWSLGLVVGAYVFGRFVAWLSVRALARWAKHTVTPADDLVLRHVAAPLRWLLPAIGVDCVLPMVPLPERMGQILTHTTVLAIIVTTGWAVFAALRVLEDLVEQRYDLSRATTVHARAVYTQLRALRNVGGVVVVMVTIAFALMTFEEVRNIGAGLLASAGVAGIVLGFAAQKTLTTLVAGIQIAFAQPIRVGDLVGVDSEIGTVEEIALTYTVVRLWDLRRLIVPVEYFLDKPFQNWTRGTGELLGTVELQLDFGVPVDDLRKELERLVAASSLWDKKIAKVQVTGASDKTMLVRVLVSAANSDDLFELRCHLREKLLSFVHLRLPGALPKQRVDAPPPAS